MKHVENVPVRHAVRRAVLLAAVMASGVTPVSAREYHVSVKGKETNAGSEAAPFRTINQAAGVACAGDVITVHAGVYREWVNPLRGGESDEKRIVYRAAPGEKVEIKGSEVVTGWQKTEGTVWKVTLPNSFFGDYNPYKDTLFGDWFANHGWAQHTGEVFINNKSLWETDALPKVVAPAPFAGSLDPEGSTYKWYCKVDNESTTLWANFHDLDPNRESVEISVRRTCFWPEKPGLDYITVSGFHVSQAASQWAAPTAEQIGMIGTHWNKGWIIESNVISNAKCSGITLGKERGTGHNVWSADRSIDGSLHYIEVTFRTLRNGWSRERIGSHRVRGNEIYDCGQTGICGSMGAAFSVIENNHIHHIYTKRQYSGAEMGGIKLHAAIDTLIRNNRIHHCDRGLWLDWMAQGTRVSSNVMYENSAQDIFMEVDHGPTLVDNNILASAESVLSQSQGGAFVHNLIAGSIRVRPERGRYTPYHLPHSTEVAGLSIILNGDDRYNNNLFLPARPNEKNRYGCPAYEKGAYPSFADGNAYYDVAQPFAGEQHSIQQPGFKPAFQIEDQGRDVFVAFDLQGFDGFQTKRVSTETLGKAKLAKEAYEQPDGAALVFDTDFQGNTRKSNPAPGPFEKAQNGKNRFKVW